MKGIHLTLESWQGGRNLEGWKLKKSNKTVTESLVEDLDLQLDKLREDELRNLDDVIDDATVISDREGKIPIRHKPDSSTMTIVLRLEADLEAMLHLTSSEKPTMWVC